MSKVMVISAYHHHFEREREGERIHSSLKSLKEAKRQKRALNCLSTLHNDIFFYIKEGQKVKEIP